MNVIWIVADTVRRDAVGAYGNKRMHTPALDALAAKSVRFDRHYVAAFPTMPARADFMTGRWTMSFMGWEPLPKGEVTLAEILSGKGINTAAIVDTPFFLRAEMNYDRGFVTCEEIPGQHYLAKGSDPRFRRGLNIQSTVRVEADCFARQTILKAMQWLELNYKEDFFLYIDTWDPHEPWNAPSYYTELYWPGYDGELIGPVYGYWQDRPGLTEEKVKKAQATYLGKMTMVDTWIGNLLRQVENMGLMENTAIIFATDHGYYFGEHGGLYGKMVFSKDPAPGKEMIGVWARSPYYEEVIALPLLIYVPNIPTATYNGLTSAIDIMPTVLDIMGQEIPSRVEGRSLLPMMKDQSLAGREHVFSSSAFVNPGDTDLSVDHVRRWAEKASMATVTTDEWSLLYDVEPGGSELYNLSSDPKQEKNVISQHTDVARELHQLFVKFMRDTKLAKRLMEPRLELRL
jgi:arylsulfatase A-like enzyme